MIPQSISTLSENVHATRQDHSTHHRIWYTCFHFSLTNSGTNRVHEPWRILEKIVCVWPGSGTHNHYFGSLSNQKLTECLTWWKEYHRRLLITIFGSRILITRNLIKSAPTSRVLPLSVFGSCSAWLGGHTAGSEQLSLMCYGVPPVAFPDRAQIATVRKFIVLYAHHKSWAVKFLHEKHPVGL